MNRNKPPLIIMAVLLSLSVHGAVNDTIPEHNNLSIVHYTNGDKQRGYILSANDSTIQFIERKYWKNELFMQQKLIPAGDITGIVKKNSKDFSMAEGMGIGALSGIIIGFAIGLEDCDDPNEDCGFFERLFAGNSLRTALSLSAILGGIGTVVGIFSGGKRKYRFAINGSRDNLKKNKYNLFAY